MARLMVLDEASGEVLLAGDTAARARRRMPRWTRVMAEMFEKAAIDQALTAGDFRVLCYMISRVVPDNWVWLYPSDIAKATGYGSAFVYRALLKLEARGYVRKMKPGLYEISPALAWRGHSLKWADRIERQA